MCKCTGMNGQIKADVTKFPTFYLHLALCEVLMTSCLILGHGGAVFGAVSMFFLCIRVFSPSYLVSTHSPKMYGRLIDN